jgi:aspartyl-tRNA(Asn)/glutamyl-tRNA(Gln) amidotransferase subunit B
MTRKMLWEIVIGLETHTQLSTVSKIFSGASTAFGAAPNSQASAVDIALPGVLPVLNKGAVERAIRFGLAVGATINRRSVFARKNYFYPDLPKGYQISQYEIPVVQGGEISIVSPTRGEIKVRLTRAHLEEDAGKSLHEDFHDLTGIDLNRAGTPLLEIVSEPDMRTAEEAIAYAKTLHALVRWIGICDGNMQEGSFRCDANVSVRPAGDANLGKRCEIKNLNSFRFMHEAIEFEVRRQTELIEDGGEVVQETRLYDPDHRETRSMRSKEDAQDYRYFPDPDLPPLVIEEKWIEQIRAEMPELPEPMAHRFVADYGVPLPDAIQLTANRETARYFESTMRAPVGVQLSGKTTANWILGEISARLNRDGIEIEQAPVQPNEFAQLQARVQDHTISGSVGKDLLDTMWRRNVGKEMSRDVTVTINGVSATASVGIVDAIIEDKGLKQISDLGAIEKLVDDVLSANPAIVAEYKAGKEKAFNSLVGKTMAATKGKANPAQVNAILKQRLGR